MDIGALTESLKAVGIMVGLALGSYLVGILGIMIVGKFADVASDIGLSETFVNNTSQFATNTVSAMTSLTGIISTISGIAVIVIIALAFGAGDLFKDAFKGKSL